MGERTSDCPQSTQVFGQDYEQSQSENPSENVAPRLGRGLYHQPSLLKAVSVLSKAN